MVTETQEIGTATNPADALPSLGRKTLAGEAAVSIIIAFMRSTKINFLAVINVTIFLYRLWPKSKQN
jgi:hypothetical protein